MRIPCDAAGIKGFVFPRLSCLREYRICSGLNSFSVLFLINPLEYFISVLNLILLSLMCDFLLLIHDMGESFNAK